MRFTGNQWEWEREGKGDTNTNTMKLIEYKNNYNIDILLHFLIYLFLLNNQIHFDFQYSTR